MINNSSFVQPLRKPRSTSDFPAAFFFSPVSQYVSMLMCVCVSVCTSVINPNDWQCPPHFLLLFLPLLTLLSATCHWDFLLSSIARLYLDGQSLPPLMYLMAYLGYCSWQGGEAYVCLYISLFKRAKHPRRVERWERLVLLLTSRAYIPNSVWL